MEDLADKFITYVASFCTIMSSMLSIYGFIYRRELSITLPTLSVAGQASYVEVPLWGVLAIITFITLGILLNYKLSK